MVGHKDLTTRKSGNQNPYPTADHRGFDEGENWRPSESVAPEADLGPEHHPGPHAGKGPAAGPRGDESLRDEIIDRVTKNADVDASGIAVEVREGRVILSGVVESRQGSELLVKVAEDVTGVTRVENRMGVRSE